MNERRLNRLLSDKEIRDIREFMQSGSECDIEEWSRRRGENESYEHKRQPCMYANVTGAQLKAEAVALEEKCKRQIEESADFLRDRLRELELRVAQLEVK
jgi:hypothetical protein